MIEKPGAAKQQPNKPSQIPSKEKQPAPKAPSGKKGGSSTNAQPESKETSPVVDIKTPDGPPVAVNGTANNDDEIMRRRKEFMEKQVKGKTGKPAGVSP